MVGMVQVSVLAIHVDSTPLWTILTDASKVVGFKGDGPFFRARIVKLLEWHTAFLHAQHTPDFERDGSCFSRSRGSNLEPAPRSFRVEKDTGLFRTPKPF